MSKKATNRALAQLEFEVGALESQIQQLAGTVLKRIDRLDVKINKVHKDCIRRSNDARLKTKVELVTASNSRAHGHILILGDEVEMLTQEVEYLMLPLRDRVGRWFRTKLHRFKRG